MCLRYGAVLAYSVFSFGAAFLVQAIGTIVYVVVPSNAAKRNAGCLEKFFILKRLEAI